MTKALVSVTGSDRTGIIAKVSTTLSDMEINILDITQTILGGYFTMMMIVDLEKATVPFSEVGRALKGVGESLGMSIQLQRMDIFDAMHKV